ncbi:MAG: hypothetical protein L0G22_06040 [Propionibacteriaceae bacterium]|nr:hypothetical protein [Propionibacteriaceae bacterium]
MTVTTIKVPVGLRDALKAQAQARGRTLGEHLEALAEAEERNVRWEELRRAVAAHPADAAYAEELRAWQSDAWN